MKVSKPKKAAEKLNMRCILCADHRNSNPVGSLEAYCREKRYRFFDSMSFNKPANILLSHHLGDATEQYLMNCMKGCPEHKPIHEVVKRDSGTTILRPFITSWSSTTHNYCMENDLEEFIVPDPLNQDMSKTRNWVRNMVLPTIQERFGLEKVVLKKFYL